VDGDIHFAFGDAAKGTTGFRLTHQQAIAAQAAALAAGSPAPRTVAFSETALPRKGTVPARPAAVTTASPR
jgi:hypothetical protein